MRCDLSLSQLSWQKSIVKCSYCDKMALLPILFFLLGGEGTMWNNLCWQVCSAAGVAVSTRSTLPLEYHIPILANASGVNVDQAQTT